MKPASAAAVVDVTNRLFAAMRERDEHSLRALIHPRAQVFSHRTDGLRIRTADEFIASVVEAAETVDERTWDEEVRIDGDIAALWAPYDVRLGERFSHRGCDSFQFVREDGNWRLISAMYTVIA